MAKNDGMIDGARLRQMAIEAKEHIAKEKAEEKCIKEEQRLRNKDPEYQKNLFTEILVKRLTDATASYSRIGKLEYDVINYEYDITRSVISKMGEVIKNDSYLGRDTYHQWTVEIIKEWAVVRNISVEFYTYTGTHRDGGFLGRYGPEYTYQTASVKFSW